MAMWGGFGDFLGKLGTALLGSMATAMFTQGANALFSPGPPSRRSMQQDIGMQRQAAEPIRTPEQVQTDQMTVEAGRQRAQTFADLSQEYAGLKGRGPVYDPATEEKIKQEAMADAAVRGMGESGQAQEMVKRRLQEYRLGRSDVHGRELGDLRSQMQPYSQVQAPGQPPIFQPQISPQPRSTPPMFTPAPVDLTMALGPNTPNIFNRQTPTKKAFAPYFDINQQAV